MPTLAMLYLRTSTLCALCLSSRSVIKWLTPIVLLRKAAARAEHGWVRSVGQVRLRQSIVNQALKLSRCLWIPPSCSLPLERCNREGRCGGRLSLNTAAAPRIVPGCVSCKLTPHCVWGSLVAEQCIKSTRASSQAASAPPPPAPYLLKF